MTRGVNPTEEIGPKAKVVRTLLSEVTEKVTVWWGRRCLENVNQRFGFPRGDLAGQKLNLALVPRILE